MGLYNPASRLGHGQVIHIKQWTVITNPCSNFNGSLVDPVICPPDANLDDIIGVYNQQFSSCIACMTFQGVTKASNKKCLINRNWVWLLPNQSSTHILILLSRASKVTGPRAWRHLVWLYVTHCMQILLTHWRRDDLAAIWQLTFRNAFSWMKLYEFHLGVNE